MIRCCPPLAVSLALLASAALHGQPPPASPAGSDGACRQPADATTARFFAVLRQQAKTDADPEKLAELAKQLGHPEYDQRERASRDLVAIGRPALARLRQARKDPDLEISRRAQMCIDAIETSLDKNAGYLAVVQLLRQRPVGTAEVLLAYLPEADAETAEEIWQGITAVAVRGGKVDVAIRAALDDKAPPRRALAALLVGRHGTDADRAAVRRHLTDADPEVRLRAAQGLLTAHDTAAVTALVGLLKDAPLDLAWQAEELLHWLAGDQAADATVGAGGAEERGRCHGAWESWWRDREARFDWASRDRDPRRPGLMLVCEPQRVWLCGCDGKPRWEIKGLESPIAVQELPGPRFLVLEPYLPRLTERDPTGKIVWQAAKLDDDGYVNAQRLPNGNTFLASMDQFLEYGPDGKPLSKIDVSETANGDVGDAVRLRGGSVIARHNTGVAEIDAASGNVIRSADVPNFRGVHMGHMAVLPNGNCLLVDMRKQRVLEVDLDGNIVWQHRVVGAVSVEGLRNGNVLVGTQREARVYEVTRDGKCVWETMLTGQANRVRTVYNRVRVGFDRPRPADFDLNSVANRIQNLKDNNAVLRRRAAAALASYGPEAKEAIPTLIETLDDQDAEANQWAVNALVSIGIDAQPALVKALHHGAPRVRAGAWTAVTRMGPLAKPVLPELLAILSDAKEESAARQSATRAIAAMGADGSDAIPAMIDALKDTDDALRNAAALALPAVGPGNTDAVNGLVAALKDAKFPQGELGAAQALRKFGPQALNAIPDLLAVSENATYTTDVRAAAVWGFADMGAGARPAVKHLVILLRDGGQPEILRIAVAQTLGMLRLEGKPALATLNEILRDPNLPVTLSAEATRALAPMGPEGLQVLTLLVNEGNTTVKLASIQMLRNMGEGAKSSLSALMEAATQDKDPEVRKNANTAARVIQVGGEKGRGRMMGD